MFSMLAARLPCRCFDTLTPPDAASVFYAAVRAADLCERHAVFALLAVAAPFSPLLALLSASAKRGWMPAAEASMPAVKAPCF
jgi:hypothetical protein